MTVQALKQWLHLETPPPVAKPSKGFFCCMEEHTETADGAKDIFDCVARIAEAFKLCFGGAFVSRVQSLFDDSGLGLSVPKIPSDGVALMRSISCLYDVGYQGVSKTAKAVEQVVVKSFLFVNSGVRTTLFLDAFAVLHLAKSLAGRLNAVSNLAFFVTDGSDLVRDWSIWQQVGRPQKENKLALLNVIKNASSVAASVILLIGYVFGLLAHPHLIATVFVLSSLYLTTKLLSCFYNKMVVQQLSPPAPVPV